MPPAPPASWPVILTFPSFAIPPVNENCISSILLPIKIINNKIPNEVAVLSKLLDAINNINKIKANTKVIALVGSSKPTSVICKLSNTIPSQFTVIFFEESLQSSPIYSPDILLNCCSNSFANIPNVSFTSVLTASSVLLTGLVISKIRFIPAINSSLPFSFFVTLIAGTFLPSTSTNSGLHARPSGASVHLEFSQNFINPSTMVFKPGGLFSSDSCTLAVGIGNIFWESPLTISDAASS